MERVEKFLAYFDAQIAACRQREKELLEDHRLDERVFEKVRGNVYDIFRTVLTVAVKQAAQGKVVEEGPSSDVAEGIRSFFLKKAAQIPKSWQTSYDKAKEHGALEKMQMESIKLETIQEIKAELARIWEEV